MQDYEQMCARKEISLTAPAVVTGMSVCMRVFVTNEAAMEACKPGAVARPGRNARMSEVVLTLGNTSLHARVAARHTLRATIYLP